MKRSLALLLAALLFPMCLSAQSGSGSSQIGAAQSKPPQQNKPPRIVIPSKAVVVPVTVKDAQGNLVANLEEEDFRVFQDGVQQVITNFSGRALPMSVVVLLDDDLEARAAQAVQQSLDSVAAGFGPNDEVALVRFDEYPKTVLDFTSNNDTLFAKLKDIRTSEKDALDSRDSTSPSMAMTSPPRLNGQPIGPGANIPVVASTSGVTKHLDDAVHYAADMLRTRNRDRRKIIFIISDGTNARYNQWNLNTTLQSLLSSNITVYAIAVGGILDRPEGVGHLSSYTHTTGGDVFHALKQGDLERMYAELTEEARNQYTLVFSPTNTAGRGNYHSLEVRVERPNLSVTARQGYFAQLQP
ncbi:MAG TPA: VWA domain-containing protein [Candidatus Acidoferrales bacterium]|nr:VWA domain-containing protein [Candidatus Acidoferrales bacterium]